MWRVVALLGLLLIGCDDDDVVSPGDMAAVFDLTVPDLSLPADLIPTDLRALCPFTPDAWTPGDTIDAGGVFCAGTPIDGTCVQAFFAKIAACYMPAGCCSCFGGITVDCDWASGASFHSWAQSDPFASLRQSGVQCGLAKRDPTNGNLMHWTAVDGTKLDVTQTPSPPVLDAQCPDGSHVSFAYNQCAALLALTSAPVQSCVLR